ncbi:hypothetical protein [Vitiosangium sp. GDMCC 1.1324]|uniref:hypothetical protein n=1 Tax=Vitiosangium sp. (strain GDMCC 1.1324) TaxID=2138576 RepID=UPI000D332705|nr:hypothetical protein [Vitiosangium sp. GDMCC 1.1324]PTL83006.1 hypothetical protein DAT35_13365 [Vitiosangium sp. GDMCC 1.1324]
MAFMSASGLGPYAAVSLTKLTGASRSASALSNIDLGVAWTLPILSNTWFALRGGMLLPTGDEDEVASSLNATVAAMRPTQAVLFQPGALGGRLGAAMILVGSSCSLRLDTGMDAYFPFTKALQLSPHWGAGFSYRANPVVATLEMAGARYAETTSSRSEMHHSLGGSLRFITDKVDSWQPGVSVSIPLEEPLERWFLGFDLTMRY